MTINVAIETLSHSKYSKICSNVTCLKQGNGLNDHELLSAPFTVKVTTLWCTPHFLLQESHLLLFSHAAYIADRTFSPVEDAHRSAFLPIISGLAFQSIIWCPQLIMWLICINDSSRKLPQGSAPHPSRHLRCSVLCSGKQAMQDMLASCMYLTGLLPLDSLTWNSNSKRQRKYLSSSSKTPSLRPGTLARDENRLLNKIFRKTLDLTLAQKT